MKETNSARRGLAGIVGVNQRTKNDRRSVVFTIVFQLDLHFETILSPVSS
jgi:hypothetical protein